MKPKIVHVSDPRLRRHIRVRAKVKGTAERPRLNVYRSLNHIYAQVIDDVKGHTIASACTLDKDVSAAKAKKLDEAISVGTLVAERALAKGVTKVVFDRGGYIYHGRIKALADAARKGGLDF